MGASISTLINLVANKVCSCFCVEVNHICSLEKNLEALEKSMVRLKAMRDDVLEWVQRDEDRGLQRLHKVEAWLNNVEIIEKQFHETHMACTSEGLSSLCEVCSKKLETMFRYGKNVFLMLEEVKDLILTGKFDPVPVGGATTRNMAEEMPLQPIIVGQETMLEKAWNHLMDDKTSIVGLLGMGGVGKTTLLKQMNNKFCGGFDVVIWVLVSGNATVHKVQGGIGEKLGFLGKEWDEKNEEQRAVHIHNALRRKKFVLLLDDIWEKVNLNVIGIPFPSRENGCKVAFTTRSRDVCGSMGVSDPIEVSCLEPDKAWDFFKTKVGENTLGSHPNIPQLARKVAGKCCGLPLALNIIGETMACKSTVHEWQRAIDVLTSSASDFSGVEDKILLVLKYSYDSLNGELVKSCFLYCSLFPEDELLEKERLVDYWVCEGFIDENGGRERAVNQGYEILGTLVRSCLLSEVGKAKSKVSMHHLVRLMALWIASDLGKNKERCIVQPGVGLRQVPKVKNWNNVRRMSLLHNEIKEICIVQAAGVSLPNNDKGLGALNITTLLLQENKLATISGEFFRSMPRLVVLDLSDNGSLSGLPEQISELVSLRYLDLSRTKINRLPVGLQELKMLIHLNLEWMRYLKSLQGISNLSSLRTLKLVRSKVWLDMSLMKELQLLQHIESISINISSSLVGELLLYDHRVGRCIKHIFIKDRSQGVFWSKKKESVRVLVLPDDLCDIDIRDCEMLEIKIEKTPWSKKLTSPCFSNLTRVVLGGCHGLKDLTWLMFAPNLVHLGVLYSRTLEYIISKEKAASVLEEETCNNILPFQKLQFLYLRSLPELKSIYWNALPFQHLRLIDISGNCQKLKKLPLDSKSVVFDWVEEFVIQYGEKEWVQGLEWEDEATRQRFLPYLI